MKSNLINTIFLSACLLFGIQCSQAPEVKKGNVGRIIQTLSSDDMMGRDAFSPDIEKAASFIASEFEQIGLKHLDAENNYHQEFTVYSFKNDESSVSLNGKEIDSHSYFTRTFQKDITWNEKNVRIERISEDDNLRRKVRDFTSDSLSSLVIIDESHLEWFNRYRRYFSRPDRSLNPKTEQNDIFILSSAKNINSVDIELNNKIDSLRMFNIAGKIEGKRKNEIVLFSAHYDHVGVIRPVNGDSIANGANDNASGVSGIIEIARFYKELGQPERTIYFVAFTAEESGGYGSEYFSKQLDPDQIVAMFNLEMIGKPSLENPNSAWITGFDYSDFGEILQSALKDTSFAFYPDPYPNQNLFYRSDNATLARLGVPAHSISTTPIDIDENYHTVSDEFHTLNLEHITRTISAVAKASQIIVSGKKTPSRIDTEEL